MSKSGNGLIQASERTNAGTAFALGNRINSAFLLLFFLFSCNNDKIDAAKDKTQNKPVSSIYFQNEELDFGTVRQGEQVKLVFKFTNKGAKPLIIYQVVPNCGCTVTDWSKNPVKPNSEGSINATFNSVGRMGVQKKALAVFSNVSEIPKVIFFTGEVKSAK